MLYYIHIALHCKPGETMCNTGGICISSSFICDGTPDCPDLSDEADCGKSTIRQSTMVFNHQLNRISRLNMRKTHSNVKRICRVL